MKTYQIEIQRLKSITHDHGSLDLNVDALVLPSPKPRGGDGDATLGTIISLSEKDARSLLILLKAQLAELEPRKGRSQR
ncbi:hypothetical protein [Sphaerotilus microaerophilus]|uniref:Uncharacterized protein n=1 Tax=Sphaerotilus microaerophilus TaxID=2914710 RepID=A0ABN6PNV9_9BURK|nr:hypothetical protein [Sphaerotilus sp. FB-5]BDI06909.1 hypothetical protein CATMQ487_38790 [Sphaerotilus sp. FB-5]